MTMFYKYGDLLHKSLSSLIFRIILIIYSIFLLQIQDNLFEFKSYIIIISIYFIIYSQLLKERKPILRTLNDYVLIFIVLYMKDVTSIYNLMLVIAPLVNAPNHSGEKRSLMLIYILTVLEFILLYGVNMNMENTNYEEAIYISISISFLVIISYLELSRARIFENVFSIYKEIDQVMRKKRNRTQIPEIYNLIINKISNKINIQIKQITCFEKKKKKKYVLKNSSQFVYQYEYDFKNLNKKVTLKTLPITINDEELSSIFTIVIRNLVFVIIIDDSKQKNISLLKSLYIISITPLIFEKIASIIDFENNLGKEEYRRLSELSKKQHFVLEVMKSTHFLSNKLSPIKNYITIRENFDSSTKIKKAKRAEIKILINKERKQAKTSLRVISEKMNLLLNKEANPFIPTSTKKIKLRYLFMLIKRLWMEKFDENNIIISNTKNNLDKKLVLNDDAIEFIFIDIFTNLEKYSEGRPKIYFDFDSEFTIQIKNKIKNYDEKKLDLETIIGNYNNDDRMEINKRNNFGLLHIKEQSQQMDINISLELDKSNKLFITKLIFKGVLYESIGV